MKGSGGGAVLNPKPYKKGMVLGFKNASQVTASLLGSSTHLSSIQRYVAFVNILFRCLMCWRCRFRLEWFAVLSHFPSLFLDSNLSGKQDKSRLPLANPLRKLKNGYQSCAGLRKFSGRNGVRGNLCPYVSRFGTYKEFEQHHIE